MNLTVAIPDDLAARLRAVSPDLERRALEAFAADEYREGRLTSSELRQLLGFETRTELDGFFRARSLYGPSVKADLERERADVARLDLAEPEEPSLAEAIRQRFAPVGGVDDLVILPREAAREPPRFDR